MLPLSLVMLLLIRLLLVSAGITPPPPQARSGPRGGQHCQCSPSVQHSPPERRVGLSGPELALQRGRCLLEGARVGARGQVLPPAVADDEADVGPSPGGHLLLGDAERRVQD